MGSSTLTNFLLICRLSDAKLGNDTMDTCTSSAKPTRDTSSDRANEKKTWNFEMMGDSFDAGLRAPPAPNVGVCTLLAARKESKDCLGDSMSLGWAIFRDFFRCMDGYTGGSRAEDKLDFRRQPQRHKCSLWTR